MSLRANLRPLAFAACVALAGLAGAPAEAVEAPAGSRNFSPPGYVPNYFSNEGGSFRGATGVASARPGLPPVIAAPQPRGTVAAVSRRHPHYRPQARRAATAQGRFRVARGRASSHRHVVYAYRARSGKPPPAKTTHALVRAAVSKTVAAKARHAPTKTKRLAQTRF